MKVSEYKNFIKTLDKMGCPYRINHDMEDEDGVPIPFLKKGTAHTADNTEIRFGKHVLVSVSQAHFVFSCKSERFLMVISDEMDIAEKRKVEDGQSLP